MRNRRPDAWDNRVEAFERYPLVMNRRFVRGNIHIGAQHVDDDYFVSALLGRFDDAPRGIQLSVS